MVVGWVCPDIYVAMLDWWVGAVILRRRRSAWKLLEVSAHAILRPAHNKIPTVRLEEGWNGAGAITEAREMELQ